MIHGVYVATISPFTSDGQLDDHALGLHLERLKHAAVDGFVACGTTAESSTLTADERKRVFSLHREVSENWIAGCGGNATQKVLALIEEAAQFSPQAALVVTPYYNRPTPAGLAAHFLYLAERSPVPLVLYHIPGRAAVTMPVELAAELLAHPRILGIKESSGNFAYWSALANSVNLGKKSLLAGDDDAFATLLSLGGSGIISASANLIPRVFVDIHRAFVDGDWSKGFELQNQALPLIRSLFLESNPGPLKYALARLGHAQNQLRLPLVPVEKNTEAAITRAMGAFF